MGMTRVPLKRGAVTDVVMSTADRDRREDGTAAPDADGVPDTTPLLLGLDAVLEREVVD